MGIKIKKNRYKGFSLIEGMIATVIVTVGMLAVVSLMTASLQSSFNSRDQVIAAMLAQEGVELVKNIRDNNWAQGKDTFVSSSFPSSKGDYRISFAQHIKIRKLDSNERLYLNSNGIYVQNPNDNTATKFSRKIRIEYLGSGDSEIGNIYSMVVWSGGSFPESVAKISDCNTINKCAYSAITLTKWGEK